MKLRRANNTTKMLKKRLPKTARGAITPSPLQAPKNVLTMCHHHQSVTLLLLLTLQQLLLLAHQCQSYQMQHEPVASNEINLQHQQPVAVNTSQRHSTRDVTNLRLMPELRSIRLRWDYERAEKNAKGNHDDDGWPASFRIRFCELTSWQAEIKCRQRDMPVQQRVNDARTPPTDEVNEAAAAAHHVAQQQLAPHDNSTVIQFGQQRPARELIRVVATSDTPPSKLRQQSPSSRTYETQIYDLRALTSYTFNVQALRFTGDSSSSSSGGEGELALPIAAARPARRLDLDTPTTTTTTTTASQQSLAGDDGEPKHQRASLSARAETRPFSAEALKCLANSSEVLVNTGRYFGGRISVESASAGPAACQLLGNRSSAQSSYLFRIDHELCHSKVLDSQRIETMILVHENKDLLTHNTARFLIQCNISQRSFTVRASVSLPKVNGLTTGSGGGGGNDAAKFRPATVTAVASPNQRSTSEEQVRLGSMPGVFRLIRAEQNSLLESESQHLPSTLASELDGRPPRASPRPIGAGRRESKELHTQQVAQALVLPRPVDVSSGILFVGRKHDAPAAAAHAAREARLLTQAAAAAAASASEQVERVNPTAGIEPLQQQQQPIVMTNNHRVAGDFLPLAQAVANLERARSAKSDSAAADAFTIKYSPESVGEYALAKIKMSRESPRATDTPTLMSSARSRSGRMRQIGDQQNSSTKAAAAVPATTTSAKVESRMGESRQATASSADSMSASESSSIEDRVSAATSGGANHTASGAHPSMAATNAPTLAQNITGALLRWSLKTLGTLARKSLDALASETELAAAAAANRSKSDPMLVTTTTSETVDANEGDVAGVSSAQAGGRASEPEGAIIRLHEGELDGFMVERRRTTEKPAIVSGPTKTTTTASIQQQQVRAATQSADLRDSRKPHQLAAPPGTAAMAHRHRSTVAPAVVSTTASKHRVGQHQTRSQQQTEPPNDGRSRFSQDDASLLPPSEDPRAPPSPSQANTAQTATSSLWPIYCLWSLVGLLGLITLVAFLLVSNRGARTATSGRFHPSSHHSRHHPGGGGGGGGILAQLNEAIHRHHTASTGSASIQNPPGLPSQEEVYVHVAKQQDGCLVQSPSVQRRDLTAPGHEQTQRRNVSHALAMSPGGSSAASTRSTSAASTANMSSGLQELGSGSANIVFSDSSSGSSGSSSVSPDHNQRPAHESYCKNHEQFVYTDYLLLSDSDCLANNCRGESFA